MTVFVLIFFSFFLSLSSFLLQARQVLEREFNNLLALGTDRRLEEVASQAAALIRQNAVEKWRGGRADDRLTSAFLLVLVERG